MDELEENHYLQNEVDVSGDESPPETDDEEMDVSGEESTTEPNDEELIASGEESLEETDHEEMDISSDEENLLGADEEDMNISNEEDDNDDNHVILQDGNLEEVEDIDRVENVPADLPLQENGQVRIAMNMGAQGPLFAGFLDNQRMNIYLQGRHDRTAKDHLLVAIAHNVAERETYKSLIGNLRWIKNCYIDCNVPTSMRQLWRVMGRDRSNLIYSVYCSLCQTKVGDGQRATRICQCGSCGPGLNTKHLANYILLPIIPQIKDILKLPHMAQSLRYRDERVKIYPDNLEDIYDGQKYMDERINGFLRDDRNLSLTLWVDGVSLAKSSNASCCPILLHINELPPYARIKHTILAGVYVGDKKPNITSLLLPVFEQLHYLHITGIPWRPDNGPEIISRFILFIFTADSVARPEVLRMMQYNSYFACPKCFIHGLRINSKTVFPDARRVLRTDQDFRNDMEEAVLTGEVVRGLKGCSALMTVSRFDLEAGVVHDDLHNYDLGCTKQLMTMYLTDTNTAWYIGDEANLRRIDERLAVINPRQYNWGGQPPQ